MMLVRFFTSGYAPCMVQAELVDKRQLARVLRHVKRNGGPTTETTVLLSHDDAAEILSRRAYKDLREWGEATVRMDRFEAFNLYGYDANTLA